MIEVSNGRWLDERFWIDVVTDVTIGPYEREWQVALVLIGRPVEPLCLIPGLGFEITEDDCNERHADPVVETGCAF